MQHGMPATLGRPVRFRAAGDFWRSPLRASAFRRDGILQQLSQRQLKAWQDISAID